jgi:hypothetical protein
MHNTKEKMSKIIQSQPDIFSYEEILKELANEKKINSWQK